ncbi:MAG: hypothetical protein AAF441_06220 [Pseudomonadota bacterium]
MPENENPPVLASLEQVLEEMESSEFISALFDGQNIRRDVIQRLRRGACRIVSKKAAKNRSLFYLVDVINRGIDDEDIEGLIGKCVTLFSSTDTTRLPWYPELAPLHVFVLRASAVAILSLARSNVRDSMRYVTYDLETLEQEYGSIDTTASLIENRDVLNKLKDYIANKIDNNLHRLPRTADREFEQPKTERLFKLLPAFISICCECDAIKDGGNLDRSQIVAEFQKRGTVVVLDEVSNLRNLLRREAERFEADSRNSSFESRIKEPEA